MIIWTWKLKEINMKIIIKVVFINLFAFLVNSFTGNFGSSIWMSRCVVSMKQSPWNWSRFLSNIGHQFVNPHEMFMPYSCMVQYEWFHEDEDCQSHLLTEADKFYSNSSFLWQLSNFSAFGNEWRNSVGVTLCSHSEGSIP